MMSRLVRQSALAASIATALAVPLAPTKANAGIEPYMGEIMLIATNFCPRFWSLADGRILSIAEDLALFSLLGNRYGGDGRETFGLPDLRASAPASAGGNQGGQPIYCIALRGTYPPRN